MKPEDLEGFKDNKNIVRWMSMCLKTLGVPYDRQLDLAGRSIVVDSKKATKSPKTKKKGNA